MHPFSDYKTAAEHTRRRLGVTRLTAKQAQAVRSGVATHQARQDNKPKPYHPMTAIKRKLHHRDIVAFKSSIAYFRRKTNTINLTYGSVAGLSTRSNYKQTKYGPACEDVTINVTLPSGWYDRVVRSDLLWMAGIPNLDVQPVYREGLVTVYRATWMVQGRGYAINPVRGWIARHDTGPAYHSTDDPQRAIRGLSRLMGQKNNLGALDRVFSWQYDDIADVTIRASDSLAAHNCQTGTDNFIERFCSGKRAGTIGELAGLLKRSGFRPTVGDDTTIRLANTIGRALTRQAVKDVKRARQAVG